MDAQAREYREDAAIKKVWQLKERLIVAVGPGALGEQVVRAGRRLADSLRAEWIAVYVETPALQRLPEAERARILRALRLAQALGAETATLPGQNVGEALLQFAAERNAAKIVLGRARTRTPGNAPSAGRCTIRLTDRSPTVDLLVVGGDSRRRPDHPCRSHASDRRYIAYRVARATRKDWLPIVLVTLVALPLRERIDIANIAMLYLMSVVVTAVRGGRGPAVTASVVGVLLLDFFCVPPYLTFAVSDTEYVLTFGVMLAVSLTITQLTVAMRYQARISAVRERRAGALYAMSRELSGALIAPQIAEIAVRHVGAVFEAPTAVVLVDANDQLYVANGEQPSELPDVDLSVAHWVYDREQPAGLGTGTLAGTRIHYVPLRAPMRNRGVLALAPRNERLIFVPEQQRLLETFAAQIALAIERVHFVEVAQADRARHRVGTVAQRAARVDFARPAHAAGGGRRRSEQPGGR